MIVLYLAIKIKRFIADGIIFFIDSYSRKLISYNIDRVGNLVAMVNLPAQGNQFVKRVFINPFCVFKHIVTDTGSSGFIAI